MSIIVSRKCPGRRIRSFGERLEETALHGEPILHVITSEHLDVAAALVVRENTPVLVLREGLVPPRDLSVLQAVMGCVTATAMP